MNKLSWQLNRMLSKELDAVIEGALHYNIIGDWDFLGEWKEEEPSEADRLDELSKYMYELSKDIHGILKDALIDKYGITVVGNKMKSYSWQDRSHTVEQAEFNQLVSTHRDAEGIVVLGAGGDPNDWIDGLVGQMQEEGITNKSADEIFDSYHLLTSTGGRHDLVMLFKQGAGLDLGKMAMWRLQFGGEISWYSDWVNNYADHYKESSKRAWKEIDEDEGEGKEFVILDGGVKARVGDRVRYVSQGDEESYDNIFNNGIISEILDDVVVEVAFDDGEAYSVHTSRLEFIGRGVQREASAPPGRKKQVEKLKEKGMPPEEAFGIAWNQYNKKHKKRKKAMKLSWQGMNDNGFKVGDEVLIESMSGFGDNGTQEIVEIKTMFRPNDGTPYRVIVTNNGQEFRADNGQPTKEPWGYYLVIPGFDKIDSDRDDKPSSGYRDMNDIWDMFNGRNRESSMKTADEIDDIQNMRQRVRERINDPGTFDWPYFYLRDGMIVDHKGAQAFAEPAPNFNTVEEAEEWLTDNNYRGTVVGDYTMKAQAFETNNGHDPLFQDQFIEWFEENKESTQLWEQYYGSPERAEGMTFNEFARGVWESLMRNAKDRSENKIKKQANAVAVNILPALFEDKFPLYRVPSELRLLRSKAKQALSQAVEHMETLGREAIPADFPMEWFYTKVPVASKLNAPQDYQNYVTETRALLEEIINYANKSVGGTDFYSSMKSTITKVSRDTEGVTILREMHEGKPYRYGYLNEAGTYIELKGFKQLPKYATITRIDKGTPIKIVGYKDIIMSDDAQLIDGLTKKADVPEGFIPTSEGMQTPEDVVSDLTFLNYAYNRDSAPEVSPERWAKIFGEDKVSVMEKRYQHEKATGRKFTDKDLTDAIIKEAIDISDEVPPMGWDATEPGIPAGAGAPKPQVDSLKSKDEKEQEKKDQGVLYDSTKDNGPQFQTTINPNDKSVTVKFMDSPEQQQFKEQLDEFDQLPKLNTTPPAQGQPSETGMQEQPGEFADQEVPVSF